jgi:hypothetical protein
LTPATEPTFQLDFNATHSPSTLHLLLQLLPALDYKRSLFRRRALESINGLSEPDQVDLSLYACEPVLVNLPLNAFERVTR